ncbi:hypothetical protein BJ912DRAFT_1043326 [Pholiota molesta]|nr:hypothetical protein BJ912DRAFT_1043326 [Pholiota molesta]
MLKDELCSVKCVPRQPKTTKYSRHSEPTHLRRGFGALPGTDILGNGIWGRLISTAVQCQKQLCRRPQVASTYSAQLPLQRLVLVQNVVELLEGSGIGEAYPSQGRLRAGSRIEMGKLSEAVLGTSALHKRARRKKRAGVAYLIAQNVTSRRDLASESIRVLLPFSTLIYAIFGSLSFPSIALPGLFTLCLTPYLL